MKPTGNITRRKMAAFGATHHDETSFDYEAYTIDVTRWIRISVEFRDEEIGVAIDDPPKTIDMPGIKTLDDLRVLYRYLTGEEWPQ